LLLAGFLKVFDVDPIWADEPTTGEQVINPDISSDEEEST
jgi:hypothetical protein